MIELVGTGKRPNSRDVAPLVIPQPPSLVYLHHQRIVPFSLAPLYAHVGVEEYIPGKFAGEDSIKGHPGEVMATVFEFKHPVVARCGDWGYRVDLMSSRCYEPFKVWLLAQFFVNRDKQEVYIPSLCQVALLDPFAYAATGQDSPATMDVFTFSSNRGRMVPVDQGMVRGNAKRCPDFVMREPDDNTLQVAKAVLEGSR